MPRARLMLNVPGGERRAGRAGADERLGAAVGDRPRGLHDRGLGRRARRVHRVGGLGDRHRRVDHLDARRAASPSSGGGAEQEHARALAGGERAPGGDLAGPRSAPLQSTATTTGRAGPMGHGAGGEASGVTGR